MREMTTSAGTVRSADGTAIAYERTGSGPALILVDGASGFRASGPMRELAGLLAPHLTVVAYDRRGRGESTDTAPYAVEREVDDLAALISGATDGTASVYGFSSGAVLALHAAAGGLPIPRLALLEPPLALDDPPSVGPDLGAEIAALVAAGRRGDAVECFQRGIGVPAEMIDGMRQSPFWPVLESVAHTLGYDLAVTGSMTAETLASVETSALVLDSATSDDRLRGWARQLCTALPHATHRSLPGEWHGVPAGVLAPVLIEHVTG